MNAIDNAAFLAQHRMHERIAARQCRRRPDLTNEVRRSLVDQCGEPGTRAHSWHREYVIDCGQEISAVAFIAIAELADWDLWTSAISCAKRSDANARRDDYSEADADDYRRKWGME